VRQGMSRTDSSGGRRAKFGPRRTPISQIPYKTLLTDGARSYTVTDFFNVDNSDLADDRSMQFRLTIIAPDEHKCILGSNQHPITSVTAGAFFVLPLCSSALFWIVLSCLQLFLTVRNCSNLVHTGSC
jgi:hypothetical protein